MLSKEELLKTERPKCKHCNINVATINFNILKDGTKSWYWRKICGSCKDKIYTNKFKYRLFKSTSMHCEICKFEAVHPCQLDVDHKDGNHKNNDKNNLQVICANCHRLKTFSNKEWQK